ncbi:unnamed protein product [Effrenium voratum]|nr:unnamed protein product [Effrenium voratum]
MSHPESMAMQSKFPVARSDFAVLENQCVGRERIDIIGVITSCDVAPTTKAKANVWLKDLTGKGMLLTLWGEKHVDKAQNFQAGFVLQVDNALLLKRGENNIEATAEHWLESDKHSFSWLHCDPRGEKADKLRALDTSRGEAISVPWTPSLSVGGRLSSDLSACYVACAANMCACGLAVAQGTIQAEMLDKLEVATHAAWLVGVVGDPVYRPCRVCGTKVNPDTGKCKRADTSSCPSQPDLALKVLATAHIADWSGAVENVLIRGEQLAALASVDDEAKLAELIAEKGTQALCFKGPFDVRPATAPNMTQGRSARRPAETTQVDAGVPTQASQFQLLAARP